MTAPVRHILLVLTCLFAGAGALYGCGSDQPSVPSETGGVDASGPGFGYGGFADRPIWQGEGLMGGAGGDGQSAAGLPCVAPTAVPLPARKAVTSSSVKPKNQVIFVRDLFDSFRSHCGGCHVDTSLGGFDDQVVTLENFPQLITADVLAGLKTDDSEKFMPPKVAGGVPWSERGPTDGVLQLIELLEKWVGAGSPTDVLILKPESGNQDERYLMTPQNGRNLTNIGNCLPDPEWFAKEVEESDGLDKMFAAATELPQRLEQTDLVSWDHAELAYRGVVAFAPAYPLFSDNAGKIRMIRVPRGKSVVYDPETGEFDIPDNTRFYKTFLKDVIDVDGKVAYRKMETRLIVVRQDECFGDSCQVRSLYGSYVWNEAETEATLLEDPLRNGEPFRDRVITYLTDEKKALEVADSPSALEALSRHYAIPGSVRCEQCHLGSPTKGFSLGFVPLQIHRRPYVKEPNPFALGPDLLGYGVLPEDDPTTDELSQLARLMELGVVTGLDHPDEARSLRDVGPAQPRNAYELTAQGYLLGNCAACHNPRGFPSLRHPELRQLLDFYPRATGGGIFQFPLDAMSPRVRRGKYGDVPVPYISPSLFDYPSGDMSKCAVAYYAKNQLNCVEAPWRSLIWRNVDTPFTYDDDFAVFPHMPRHGSGHDCRAGQIVADWMVSIPSALDPIAGAGEEKDLESAQPYTEVLPGEADYRGAIGAANQRIKDLHSGERYSYCPDTADIQDPAVLAGKALVPADHGYMLPDRPIEPWLDGVPDRPHWVVLDNTQVPGDWTPRRSDWADILLGRDPDKVAALDADERQVVELLASDSPALTPEFRSFALTEVPFGLWKNDKAECNEALAAMPTLSSLPEQQLPRWAAEVAVSDVDRPIYSIAPGAAVFSNICRNCHGPSGNGDSALAGTIAEVTGGGARVADLQAGLFGPVAQPGAGRSLVFGGDADDLGIATDDLAVRYLLWMALGGTQVTIPQMALRVVANANVLGTFRHRSITDASANMLVLARELCGAALPDRSSISSYDLGAGRISNKDLDPLIQENGDAELWIKLCSFGLRTPVRMLKPVPSWTQTEGTFSIPIVDGLPQLIEAPVYGDSPVMTRHGITQGVAVGEPDAWCVLSPTDAAELAAADAYLASHAGADGPVPYCPDGRPALDGDGVAALALKGAVNAGMAAFVYLDAVARGEVQPMLQHDECHRLNR